MVTVVNPTSYMTACSRSRVLAIMDVLKQVDWSSVRTPQGGDKVYKDECVYCFDNPVS